jgi:hypothetical protein
MHIVELAQDRILNGLLKGFEGSISPEQANALLTRDVVVHVPCERVGMDDLGPAIWALASVLERQFRGRVYLDIGSAAFPQGPVPLGPRCKLGPCEDVDAISIGLGNVPSKVPLQGDARLHRIGITPLDGARPSPIECFAIAGYLGYSAIALALDIPSNREWAGTSSIEIAYSQDDLTSALRAADGFTLIGLGQVGQAFLALLWFLYGGDFGRRALALIDPQQFEDTNQRTQILLSEGGSWEGAYKATYVGEVAQRWNASPRAVEGGIGWGWQRGSFPGIALVGPHDFEVRRMACKAGFTRIVECGVGTDLLAPRVSWHAISGGSTARAAALFPDSEVGRPTLNTAPWIAELKKTPGECGWVQFLGVSSTAPCLGIAAVAYAMAEIASSEHVIRGSSLLWSQLLPRFRESVSFN